MVVETEREDDGRLIAEIPSRLGWPDFAFAFHDREEIGPRMPARIAKQTGLIPGDLK
jgi:hypothetical protein